MSSGFHKVFLLACLQYCRPEQITGQVSVSSNCRKLLLRALYSCFLLVSSIALATDKPSLHTSEQSAEEPTQSQMQDDRVELQLKLLSLENQISDLQRLLSARDLEVNKLQAALLKARSATGKPPITPMQLIVDAGPAIEIIEPEITITRGAESLQIATGDVGTVDIIGRVKPVEEVLSFKINNEIVPLNQNGVFKYAANASASSIKLMALNNEGIRTDLVLWLHRKSPKTAALMQAPDLSGIKYGNYHALIIGNNRFDHLQNLKTAENDAIAVETLLREHYGFKTKLLLNANRYDTLSALNDMRATLTDKDNLVIYYAGHGESANDTGYWMPVDAEPDNNSNWISNKQITTYIETMKARHILVIADSVYSGTLSRASLSQLSTGLTAAQQRKWYELNTKSRVRTVLTSGGVKPVIDSAGGSKHSVFTRAILDELENADKPVISAYKLFLTIQQRVRADAERIGVDQNPQYAAMQYAGHESGEFLFVRSSNFKK